MLVSWAAAKRDKTWVCIPPSGLWPPSRVPMKKMRAFFSWEPHPPQAGEGIFSCNVRAWARAKRDKCWFLERPLSGIKSGFSSGIKNPAVAGFGFAGNGGASNNEVHQFAGHNDAFFRRFALGVARHVGMGEGGGNDGVVIRICCHADFCAAFAVDLHGEGDVVLL